MINPVQKCVTAIEATLATMPEFSEKVWSVVSEDDLFNKDVGLSFPCVAVVYEGLKEVADQDRAGRSAEITFSLFVLYKSGSIGKVDNKPKAVALLDSLRNKFLGTVSPTGHKWRFRYESPAENMKGALVYYQRWTSNLILG